MSDDDPLLGIAFYHDQGLDVYQFFLFLKQLDYDFHRIRYFFLVIQQDLLTNDLCNKETGRLVGKRVFSK